MSVTLVLEEPLAGDEHSIECESVRIIGQIVWATPEGGGQETVVPLSNVVGVQGDQVEQEIDVLEAPGGQFTELVTEVC